MVRLDSVAPTMVTVGLCCVMVGSLTQHNGTRGRREWRGGRNGSLLCNLTLFALWKETPGDTWRGEEGKTGVCFPKRLSSVCGREDPACGQTDTRGKKGERTSGDMEESKG